MNVDQLVWGVVPGCLGVGLILAALNVAIRRRSPSQFALTIATATLSAVALWMLWRIFVLRAWPTILPHLLLVCAGISFAMQRYLQGQRR